MTPYFLRKVRILNGGHTALLIKAWPRGFRTVREAVEDPSWGRGWNGCCSRRSCRCWRGGSRGRRAFARQTLERFRNPFLEHKLSRHRRPPRRQGAGALVPTRDEYRAKFGRTPPLLDEVLRMPAPAV